MFMFKGTSDVTCFRNNLSIYLSTKLVDKYNKGFLFILFFQKKLGIDLSGDACFYNGF